MSSIEREGARQVDSPSETPANNFGSLSGQNDHMAGLSPSTAAPSHASSDLSAKSQQDVAQPASSSEVSHDVVDSAVVEEAAAAAAATAAAAVEQADGSTEGSSSSVPAEPASANDTARPVKGGSIGSAIGSTTGSARPHSEQPGDFVTNGATGSARRFVCSVCNHTFTRRHNLKSHMLIHTDEKPFQCPHCPRQFRRHHDLRRHMKMHSGEKPFVCEDCSKGFARADALLRHRNSPSGCRAKGPRHHKRRHQGLGVVEVGATGTTDPAITAASDAAAADADAAAADAAAAAASSSSASFSSEPDLKKKKIDSAAIAAAANTLMGTTNSDNKIDESAVELVQSTGSGDASVMAKMYQTISMLQNKIKSLEKKVETLQG